MERIIEEVTIKQVKYKSKDGKLFDSEEMCLRHENNLKSLPKTPFKISTSIHTYKAYKLRYINDSINTNKNDYILISEIFNEAYGIYSEERILGYIKRGDWEIIE